MNCLDRKKTFLFISTSYFENRDRAFMFIEALGDKYLIKLSFCEDGQYAVDVYAINFEEG